MSALGQKRTSRRARAMSALPPKADIDQHGRDVRFVPKADIARRSIECRYSAALLLSLAPHVAAILVKNEVRDLRGVCREELQLGVHDFREELALRLRKERDFALMGRLRHQLPILQSDGDRECGRELIDAGVCRENCLIDLDARPDDRMKIRPAVDRGDAAQDLVRQ